MACELSPERLSDYMDGALLKEEHAEVEAHLNSCSDCRQALSELRWMTQMMAELPDEPMPADLAPRIHAAIAALPSTEARPWHRAINWPSAFAGAAVAAAAIVFFSLPPALLPRIETAAVTMKKDVAVNIGFDVASSMDGVTFQIDLPEGLQFVDEESQPLLAQSVSWRGSLKQGKTVVPIVVRGVRPGRWEIQATIRKGPMMRKTTIVMPVNES